MPTTSIIAAVMSHYDGLTAANFPDGSRPSIYLDSAPLVNGSQVYPPYVILKDQGQTPIPLTEFERNTLEVCQFVLEVYYRELGDVDTAVAAIKLNGGTRDQAQGFDCGTLSDLTSPRSTHQVLRTRETRSLAGYDREGKRVHVCRLEYKVTVKESS